MGQIVVKYRKGERVRWISHLDLKRTLERAMRRAGLPLALTQGHNPHPKLSLGPPLPLGVSSDVELLALRLAETISPAALKERLNAQLPPGLEVLEAWTIPAYRRKETFGEIEVAEYLVNLAAPQQASDLQTRVERLLAEGELNVQRGGERPERTVNLRPLILGVDVVQSASGGTSLRMRLRTGSHGGARPQEVAALLGLSEEEIESYHRSGLYALPQQASARPGAGRRRWQRPRRSAAEES